MNKKIICLLCVFILIIFSSCKNDRVEKNENKLFMDTVYNYESDWQYYYGTGDLKMNITCSPNGYYICHSNGYTRFVDSNTYQIIPLCGKANCNHTDKNICDAYVDKVYLGNLGALDGLSPCSVLQYYKGKLYYLMGEENELTMNTEQYFAQMDLDGKNIKKVTNKLSFGSSVFSWIIHRGYIYAFTSSDVYKISIDNKSTEKIFSMEKFIRGTNNIRNIVAYGDDLYIKYNEIIDDNGEIITSGELIYNHINLNTMEMNECIFNDKMIYISSFINGRILFSCESSEENMMDYYYTDPNFTEFEKLITLPVGEHLSTDGEYYYIDDGTEIMFKRFRGEKAEKPEAAGDYYGQTITVYDMNMNEVDSFIIPSKKYYDFIAPQDPNVFILFLPDDEIQNKYHVSVIEKSKIGTFNGKPAELTDVGEWG